MSDITQNEFRETELDRDLLRSEFKVQTSWVVITGAACSGKTTLIDQLAEKGFQTVPEAGRIYFERELANGRSIEEIREDQASCAHEIYDIMVENENGMQINKTIFLDRALPDGFAFFRFTGVNPNKILLDCFQHHYACVFILDRLPYQRDGVRVADDQTAAWYDSWMFQDYSSLGYDVVRVPVLPPEERLEFVLKKLSEQGLV